MFVNPELHGKKRQEQLDESAKKATREHEEAKKNSRFTQVSPKGWERVRELLTDKQGVAALRLYSFLAEHIDPACGAVVADQQFLADKMGVNRSTIIRWLNYLESKNALVRIPVAGKVCAYALDPHEVWKGYNSSKDYAASRDQDACKQRWRDSTEDHGYVFRSGKRSRAEASDS